MRVPGVRRSPEVCCLHFLHFSTVCVLVCERSLSSRSLALVAGRKLAIYLTALRTEAQLGPLTMVRWLAT